MTGTSIDGIDAALIAIDGRGLEMRATLLELVSSELRDLAAPLRALADQQPMTAAEISRLAWEFGELHANVIGSLLTTERRQYSPDLIAVHGQTVFHDPPRSWQLINAQPIAFRFDCPVVFDLRQADLAAGGQGAPITPIADWILFHDLHKSRAVINLGGFCNVTHQPARRGESAARHLDHVRGGDVCACNQLLDTAARVVLNQPFDPNGNTASQGAVNLDAAGALVEILRAQADTNRSLGTGDEATTWINQWKGRLEAADLLASCADAIGQVVASSPYVATTDEMLIAGGGVMNQSLVDCIIGHSNAVVRRTDDLGIPVQAREAVAMAILGALSADGIPITLPHITGCSSPAPVAGVWIKP